MRVPPDKSIGGPVDAADALAASSMAKNSRLFKKLNGVLRQAKEREARPVQEPVPQPAPPPAVPAAPTSPKTKGRRKRANRLVKERNRELNGKLFHMEQQGRFNTYPLVAQNEFPTLLTRLPVFRPTHRSKQKKLLNDENELEFSTPFGNGKRHGPLLTVRDEDTLIAIMRLRDRRIYGNGHHLPIPIGSIPTDDKGKVQVHCVLCTVQDLNREKQLTSGGENYRATMQSIRRLAGTRLEFNIKRHERYLGSLERGSTISLLDVEWAFYDEDGMLLIQIPPVIAYWLEQEYTYIDWHLRLKLNDLGKSLHRFLSSQPCHYQGEVEKIAQTIGYDGPSKNIKPRFREALEKLRKENWLRDYHFTGTGRASPLKLNIAR